MSKLMLYVPTRGRPADQLTLHSLPTKWLKRTIVVCPLEEMDGFNARWPVLKQVVAPKVKDLASKRAWIFENTPFTKIMMLDDDIRFYVRDGARGALYRPEHSDHRLNDMFEMIELALGIFAHVGISDRFMNHVHTTPWKSNARCLHALGYHVPTVLKVCELNRIRFSHDMDYNLQLLRAGYENRIFCYGAQEDPKGFSAPGGLSLYRTPDKATKSYELLARLHPGCVSLRPYKEGSDLYEKGWRWRTFINWKKAIQEGLEARGVKYGTITGKPPR